MTDGFKRFFGQVTDASWHEHIFESKRAWEMVLAARDMPHPAPEDDFKGLKYMDEAIRALQGNPGHAGIAALRAHNGHHHTMAWFSVDESGAPLVGDGIIAIENGERCPPFC